MEQNKYALTRRGIIFVTCMALYKDNAMELCQAFDDLHVLDKDERETEREIREGNAVDVTEQDKSRLKKIGRENSARKSCQKFFTFFSQKRSYGAVPQNNKDYISFLAIIDYLNKVPPVCHEFLSLDNEHARMEKMKAESTESEKHKEKYDLHKRSKSNHLHFLAKYCEDFGKFPMLHFKRLNPSQEYGRARYCFGIPDVSADGEDTTKKTHYAIIDDGIRFEYLVKNHVCPGGIHIHSLRSNISANELGRLILTDRLFDKKDMSEKVSTQLESYFAAYARILERAINEKDCSYIDRTPYLEDMKTVSGANLDELKDNAGILNALASYFPENFIRFFIPKDNIPTEKELRENLLHALRLNIARDEEYLQKLEDSIQKKDDKDKDGNGYKNKDTKKWTDIFYVERVFDLLNLYLPDEKKFRLLPVQERHREPETIDFEYQTVTYYIANFEKKSSLFFNFLSGKKSKKTSKETDSPQDKKQDSQETIKREELKELEEKFKGKIKEIQKKCCPAPGKRIQKNLKMLGWAAILLHKEYCDEVEKIHSQGIAKRLKGDCHKFKVKTGMQLTHDAILKTVLHIDEEKWLTAFDRTIQAPYQNRNLKTAEDLIAPQVAFPNNFCSKFVREQCQTTDWFKNVAKDFINDKSFDLKNGEKLKGNGDFDFARYCQCRIANEKLKVGLRDYYDYRPLIRMKKSVKGTLDTTGTNFDSEYLAGNPQEIPSKSQLEKIKNDIKDVHCKDIILLMIALEYHRKFSSQNEAQQWKDEKNYDYYSATKSDSKPIMNQFGRGKDFDIYNILSNQQTQNIGRGMTGKNRTIDFWMRFYPNDRLRPSFTLICDKDYFPELVKLFPGTTMEEPAQFYDVSTELRRIQVSDLNVRCLGIPIMSAFEYTVDTVVEPIVNANRNPNAHTTEEKARSNYRFYVDYQKKNGLEDIVSEDDFVFLNVFRNKLFHKGFNLQETDCERLRKIVVKQFGVNV